ncbi:MAG: MobH family relaxase [Candidatus Thiodiazotropha endolucinida]
MMWFWRKTRKTPARDPLDLHQLDFNKLPVLKAQEIIELLGLENRLKSIEKLTGTGSEYYQLLYVPALLQYIESIQLAPASASHHHAGPGGLAVHTLDVIDIALRKRKSYNLPQQSVPEVIARQEHVWTYAVFAGALLHDIGKLVCNTQIVLSTGAIWTPHDSNILNAGATHYSIDFNQAPYNLHTRLSNGFLHILPPRGRGWLAQFPEILSQLTAWLAGELYEWGVIGEIVRQSDQESVAKNLKLGGDRKRFPGAPTIPLVDKLTTALRQLIDEGKLKINRPDGSAGWCDGPYTYLVCGTVANAVRTHLHNAGANEVPLDNSRLFDTWQEHGFIENTPEGGAIWHLTINDKLTLTVLKFETGRIFHPSRRPDAFRGKLEVSDKKPAEAAHQSSESGNSDITRAPKEDPHVSARDRAQSDGAPTHDVPLSDPDKTGTPDKVRQQSDGTPITMDNASDKSSNQSEKSENVQDNQKDNNRVKEFYTDETKIGKSADKPGKSGNASNSMPPSPTAFTLDDPELAALFLSWLKTGLQENHILVNRSDALLHVVKEGVLVVSPITFKKFARQFELVGQSEGGSETKAANKIQKMLERKMTKEQLHLKTKSGMNIHTYLVQGDHKESKIRGWLLPISVIYGNGPAPDPNPALMNLSGFLEKSSRKQKQTDYFLNFSGE